MYNQLTGEIPPDIINMTNLNNLFSTTLFDYKRIVFLFIYLGSLFSNGNGKIYTVVFGFILGIYLSKKLSSKIKKTTYLKFINFFV